MKKIIFLLVAISFSSLAQAREVSLGESLVPKGTGSIYESFLDFVAEDGSSATVVYRLKGGTVKLPLGKEVRIAIGTGYTVPVKCMKAVYDGKRVITGKVYSCDDE